MVRPLLRGLHVVLPTVCVLVAGSARPLRAADPASVNVPADAVFGKRIAFPPGSPWPMFPPYLLEHVDGGGGGAVDCEITLAGTMRDCRIVAHQGSPLYAQALLDWLGKPGLAFEPMTRNGAPIVGRHIFKAHFVTAPPQPASRR